MEKYKNLKDKVKVLEEEIDNNDNISCLFDLGDMKELRELLKDIDRLNKRIEVQVKNIDYRGKRIDLLNEKIDILEDFKTEHAIMKRIIKENGLGEKLLNDDEFIKHLKSGEKRLLKDVDEEVWSTKCEWCGEELYEDWTCTSCGEYTEHK